MYVNEYFYTVRIYQHMHTHKHWSIYIKIYSRMHTHPQVSLRAKILRAFPRSVLIKDLVYMYIYKHIYMYIHMYMYISICMFIYIEKGVTQLNVSICERERERESEREREREQHTHNHTPSCGHMYTHKCTHTHTHTLIRAHADTNNTCVCTHKCMTCTDTIIWKEVDSKKGGPRKKKGPEGLGKRGGFTMAE